MSFFYRKVPRTRKPSHDVQIDYGNPLSRGIKRAYLFNQLGAYELVTRSFETSINNANVGVDSNGKYVKILNAGSTYFAQTTPAKLHNGEITLITKCLGESSGFYHMILAGDSSISGKRDFQFRFNTSNQIEFIVFVGGSAYTAQSTATKTTTKAITAAARYKNGEAQIWVDGVKDGSNTSMSGALDSDTPRFSIGSRATSTSVLNSIDYGNTRFYIALVFDVAKSDAEIKALSENPYQLLQPINQPLFISTAAVGGATGKSNPIAGPMSGPLAGPIGF